MYDSKDIPIFLIVLVFFLIMFFLKKPTFNNDNHELNLDDEQQTLEDYWQSYDPAASNSSISMCWNILCILVAPSLFIYGYFYNEQIYLYSKYFLIAAECISSFILFLAPSDVIIKTISYLKITTILSVLSTVIVMIAALIFGDLLFAAILFFGLFYFLNKVFD